MADGAGGALVIIVGVGTGGSVSGGNGPSERAGGPVGDAELGCCAAGALLDAGGAAEASRAGSDPRRTGVSGAGVDARAGAAPIPPAPAGAATAGGGVRAGSASVQPTVTANGKPSATMPKKMDLGESRTP